MDLTAAHNARRRTLDPLLGDQPALDEADPGFLAAETAGGRAAAIARTDTVEPDSFDALWGALRRDTLDVRLAGSDPSGALGRMLDDWLDRIAAEVTAGDPETSARVSLASRDIAVVNTMTERGFAPNGIQAVRLLPRGVTPTAPLVPTEIDGAHVRLATLADADRLGELDEQLLAFDAHFGGVSTRPGAGTTFADAYRMRLAAAPDTTWVLERDGRITGFLHLMPHHGWSEPGVQTLAVTGGQYLFVMYLEPAERGAGTGAKLCALAHAAIDAAGAPYTLLSYAVGNPRSGPFWARMGYRPVITDWQRRPAVFRR